MIKPPPPDHVGDPVQSPSAVNLPNALTLLRIFLVPVLVVVLLTVALAGFAVTRRRPAQ